MQFIVDREAFVAALQLVSGAVERRHTLAILSNVLLSVQGKQLSVTATDLEIELTAQLTLEQAADTDGQITVPAKKLFDICRSLPDGSQVRFEFDGDRMLVRSGRSRFSLLTLAATGFPKVVEDFSGQAFSLLQKQLVNSLQQVHFCMAAQDVRYYLNGVLLEIDSEGVVSVATDGHRLAWYRVSQSIDVPRNSVIVPRKAVQELLRLLSAENESSISVALGENHLQIIGENFQFFTKLIDGAFPDYHRVIPKNHPYCAKVDRDWFRQSVSRASILSNEKQKGIRLIFSENRLHLQANNPEQEEAMEELEIEYSGPDMETAFNATYLLESASALKTETIQLYLNNSNASLLIEDESEQSPQYVVMPVRL